jgi:hypothetical protein
MIRLAIVGGVLVVWALAMMWLFSDADCAKVTGFLGDHERVAPGRPDQVLIADEACSSGKRWVRP